MMECMANNAGGKGAAGKPMVVSLLTPAIITVASFLTCFVGSPAPKLRDFMVAGSPGDSEWRIRTICV